MRDFVIPTKIMGDLRFTVIFSQSGVWTNHEELQAVLREVSRNFTVVSEHVWNHAKAGHTAPLVKQLNLQPQAVVRRIPLEISSCYALESCPLAQPRMCWAGSGKAPECYMPTAPDGNRIKGDLHQIIWSMMGGGYVLIVERDEHKIV